MEFFINKKATLPILRVELIDDGKNDNSDFYEKIQNANIYFTMTNIVDGVKKIAKKQAFLEPKDSCFEEFYICYQFNERETNCGGRYIAQFEIEFLDGCGILILPIREELYINVVDSWIKK